MHRKKNNDKKNNDKKKKKYTKTYRKTKGKLDNKTEKYFVGKKERN